MSKHYNTNVAFGILAGNDETSRTRGEARTVQELVQGYRDHCRGKREAGHWTANPEVNGLLYIITELDIRLKFYILTVL